MSNRVVVDEFCYYFMSLSKHHHTCNIRHGYIILPIATSSTITYNLWPLLPCCVTAVDWSVSTEQYQGRCGTGSPYLPLHHHHLDIMLLLFKAPRLHTLLLSNQFPSPHPLHAPLGLPHQRHTSQHCSLHARY